MAARLARGDEAAFAELYDACADRLFAYLTARLRSRDRAADVLQEAFLRAVENRRRFRKVENPVAYLFQIARNEAVVFNAREKRRATKPFILADMFIAAGTSESRENAELAASALNRIDPDDRELVELKVFGGLTFREISDLTGIPQATVATKYRRALEQLRPWLAKQYS
ncbi:MAG TPA: RNA polymerase sigma factor [Pirellulales bacterium]|nr:RNA polymerase sigma factor [Pirellulales bacterium]